MSFLNNEWFSVSESSRLRALDLSVILASALFWSWLALTSFVPTFFEPFGFVDAFPLFRAVVLVASLAVLLLAAASPKLMTKLLDSRRWELSLDAASIIAGLAVMVGAQWCNGLLIASGGLIIGVALTYFMLEWCRMYSRRGARTAAPLISGALALSFFLDFIFLALDSLIRAVVIAVLPAIIVLTLYAIQALVRSAEKSGEPIVALFDPLIAIGASELMTIDESESDPTAKNGAAVKPPRFPIALAVSALFCGAALGLLAESSALWLEDFNMLLACGALASTVIFACSCLRPMLFRIGVFTFLVIGFGSLMLLDGYESIHWSTAMAFAGIVGYFSGLWALCGFHSANARQVMIRLFAVNLLCFEGGLAIALAMGSGAFGGQLAEIMANIAAFALVLATLLLAISWANPINIFEKPLPSEKKKLFEDTKQHTDEIARTVSSEYGLTEREREILGHLITGRSRPRIAEILCVTENTVNSHIQHIYRKIGVHSFQELLDLIYAEQNKR